MQVKQTKKLKQYQLDDISIEIQYKTIKNTYIRIKDTSVIVSASKRIKEHDLIALLEQKSSWIKQKVKQQNHIEEQNKIIWQTGSHHYFLGKAYPIKILEQQKVNNVEFDNQVITIYLKASSEQGKNNDATCQALLHSWYREKFYELMPVLAKKWQEKTGLKANEWRVKKMSTRWGSCNTKDKRIWLSLSLIRMPVECIEHVMLHELVHFLEKGHNKHFYGFMDKYMHDWRENDKIMKEFGMLKD